MTKEPVGKCSTSNKAVLAWVEEMVNLCKPDEVYWCNGSKSERKVLLAEAVEKGILVKLNQKKLPGCYYHRSVANDVARVEQATFICTESEEEAGPTNNWMAPKEMYQKLRGYLKYGHTFKSPDEALQNIRSCLYEEITGRNLEFH